MSIMQIGGKYTANGTSTAVGVEVDSSGKVSTNKNWRFSYDKAVDSYELRDTNTHYSFTSGVGQSVDVRTSGLVSLRIKNTTDQNITITLIQDTNKSASSWLVDADGMQYSVVCGGGSTICIITPNDWPVLNYLSYLNLRFSASVAPTKGSLTVEVYTKS